MTRGEKINELELYCDHNGTTCDNCELMAFFDDNVNEFTDSYSCCFRDMDDEMLNKCYNWYKQIDSGLAPTNDNEVKRDTIPVDSKTARHYAICQKLNAVYKAKNHDYGDSFGDTFKKLGIISAVTRLSDKMNRLMSLAVAHDAQVKDEKIEDTLLDMANYAIMTLIELGYEPEN